jgi:hypothetical protein
LRESNRGYASGVQPKLSNHSTQENILLIDTAAHMVDCILRLLDSPLAGFTRNVNSMQRGAKVVVRFGRAAKRVMSSFPRFSRGILKDLFSAAALFVLAALTLSLAYQTRFPLRIGLGGGDVLYEYQYLHGFFPSQTGDNRSYRFTNGDGEITLLALGRQSSTEIALDLNAWRPDRVGQVELSLNGKQIRRIANAGWKIQRISITNPQLLNSDYLSIGIHSDTFVPAQYYRTSGISEALGVAVESLTITPQSRHNENGGIPLTNPAWGFVIAVAILSSSAFLASVTLGSPRRFAVTQSLIILLFFTVLVAFFRISVQAYLIPIAALVTGASLTWNVIKRDKTRDSIIILMLSFLLLLALVPRLGILENAPLDGDEQVYVPVSAHYADALVNGKWSELVDYQVNAEHPVFVKLLYGGAIAVARELALGWSDVTSARSVAVGASGLLVAFLASLNPMAAALLAIHSIQIKYSSEAYLEAVPALTAALSVVLFERSRAGNKGWMYLSAALLGITAASKYIYAIGGLAVAPVLLWEDRHKPLQILFYGLVAAAFFFLADPILWNDPVRHLVDSFAFHESVSQSGLVQSYNRPWWWEVAFLSGLSQWNPGIPYFSPDTLTFIAGFLGLPSLGKRSRVYLLWFGVALLFLLLWSTKWEQYSLTCITPLALAAGYGITDAMSFIRKRVLAYASE